MGREEGNYGRDYDQWEGRQLRRPGNPGPDWSGEFGEWEGGYGGGPAGGRSSRYDRQYQSNQDDHWGSSWSSASGGRRPGSGESRNRGYDRGDRFGGYGEQGGYGGSQGGFGYGGRQGGYGGHAEAGRQAGGWYGGEGGYGGYGGGSGPDSQRSRGGEFGYPGRQTGYAEGWQEEGGRGRNRDQGGGWERTRASQIMTENPHSVTPQATLAEVARQMRDLDVGIIPVVESENNRRLRGVITDRDIAVRAVADGKDGSTAVSECMSDGVRSVNKNDSIQDVMRLMREEQVRRVPVTDREGRLVGIIAQADLAVDYASQDRTRGAELGATIERISEPAEPNRSGGRMAASDRGDSTGEGGARSRQEAERED
jgi:CBS domain-containing protein